MVCLEEIKVNLDPLIYFINERHHIYLRRQAGSKPPWTSDPILANYRFCNVFRELDRTTTWIREHWRDPMDRTASVTELWFWMVVARLFNWIPTLQVLNRFVPSAWNPDRVQTILEIQKEEGNKIYTSAYMLRGPAGGGDKIEYTVWKILQPLWDAQLNFELYLEDYKPGLQDLSKWFQNFHGIGPFLAYEIVTDLRHTRYLRDAPDINSWANAGPGAIRGLNRLLGRPLKSRMKQEEALHLMTGLLDNLNRRHRVPWGDKHKYIALAPWIPQLELRDVEHSLCEVDKYLRVTLGEGAPRERFHAQPLHSGMAQAASTR
jgi:hypothetical protein